MRRWNHVVLLSLLVCCSAPSLSLAQETQAIGVEVLKTVRAALSLGDTKSVEENLVKLEAVGENADAAALVLLGDVYSTAGPWKTNKEKALRYYQIAADMGDSLALTRLGDLYREGKILPQDLETAFTYYKQAGAKNNSTGKMRVGEAYLYGKGVVADMSKGLALLEEVAAKGHATALQLLGDAYSRTSPLPLDGIKAVEFYQKSADAGSAYALTRVGDLYRDGSLVPADPDKAFRSYDLAASKGNTVGKIRLADCYIRGFGTVVDRSRGLSMLNEVANSGDLNAMQMTGDYLRAGEYIEADSQSAIDAYERLAEGGNLSGYTKIAEMYIDGTAGVKNPQKAIRYYEKAIQAGLPGAELGLLNAHVNGRLGKLSTPALSFKKLIRLANGGNAEAVVTVANAYYWGSGGAEKNPKRAIAMLTKASESGNMNASRRLLVIYRDAPGGRVSQSITLARKVLEGMKDRLDPISYKREKLIIDASVARTPAEMSEVATTFGEISTFSRPATLFSIKSANANAYVFIVQKRLSDAKLYDGPISGLLTASTIRVINSICETGMGKERCKKGPLDSDAVRQVAIALSQQS